MPKRPPEPSTKRQARSGLVEVKGRDPLSGVRRSFYGHSRAEAEAARADWLARLAAGMAPSDDRATVEQFLLEWLDQKRPAISAATYLRYESIISANVIPHLGAVQLRNLTPAHLLRLYSELRKPSKTHKALSESTIHRVHTLLHAAFGKAVQWGSLLKNPVDAVDAPRDRRAEMRVLTGEQVRVLVDAAEGLRLKPIVQVALVTAARLGEVLALRWSDFDAEAKTIAIRRKVERVPGHGLLLSPPKTAGSRRAIPLDSATVDLLLRHKAAQNAERLAAGAAWADRGLIFPGKQGKPLIHSYLYRTWYRLLARAGLPAIRPHDLRHTAATLLLEAGVHPKIVAERLGHASVGITLNRYSHVLPAMSQQAAQTLGAAVHGLNPGAMS